MIVDPVEMLMKTSSLLVPTATSKPSAHHPLPTILPDTPSYQAVHEDGKRTLWYVCQLHNHDHKLIELAGWSS